MKYLQLAAIVFILCVAQKKQQICFAFIWMPSCFSKWPRINGLQVAQSTIGGDVNLLSHLASDNKSEEVFHFEEHSSSPCSKAWPPRFCHGCPKAISFTLLYAQQEGGILPTSPCCKSWALKARLALNQRGIASSGESRRIDSCLEDEELWEQNCPSMKLSGKGMKKLSAHPLCAYIEDNDGLSTLLLAAMDDNVHRVGTIISQCMDSAELNDPPVWAKCNPHLQDHNFNVFFFLQKLFKSTSLLNFSRQTLYTTP